MEQQNQQNQKQKQQKQLGQLTVRQGWGMFLWLAAWIGFALWRVAPPSPVPESALPTAFSAARALKHLPEIARAPHPVGSAENARVREYLLAQFKALGITAKVEEGLAMESGAVPRMARVKNILAQLPGTAGGNGPALLLAAHYDSVPTGPGASDDGISVVALLETARALKAGPPLKNDIYFLLTDGEEMGLLGARAFVDSSPTAKRISIALNFEARGIGGPVFMFETSDGNRQGAGAGNAGMIAEFARAAPNPVASSLMYALYKRLPNDTDLTVFRKGGIAGLNFACVDGWTHYHTQLDDVQSASPAAVQHHGSYALALAQQFGNADLTRLKESGGGDAIYFDLLGYTLIRYPQAWALWLTIGVAVLYFGLLIFGLAKKHLTSGGFVTGLIIFPACLAGVGFGASYLWTWLAARNPYYFSHLPWGDPYDRVWFEAGFNLLALAVFLIIYGLLLTRIQARDLGMAALFWWLVLLIAATIFLPGATYAFVWPILGALFSCLMLFGVLEHLAPGRFLILFLAAPGTLVLWMVLLRGFWFLMSVNRPYLGPGLVVLLGGILLPQLSVATAPRRWIAPLLCLLAGAGLIVVGTSTERLDTRHRGGNSLVYAKEAEGGPSVWATSDRVLDSWVSGFLKNNQRVVEGQTLFPGNTSKFVVGDAPALGLLPPNITVEANETNAGVRKVRLRITMPQAGTILAFASEPGRGTGLKKVTVDGLSVPIVSGGFQVQYLTVPSAGAVVELQYDPSAAPVLLADALTPSLPAVEGTAPKRPDHLMPSPVRDRYTTDVAISRRIFMLPEGSGSTGGGNTPPPTTAPTTTTPPVVAPAATPSPTPAQTPQPTPRWAIPTPTPRVSGTPFPAPTPVPNAPPDGLGGA